MGRRLLLLLAIGLGGKAAFAGCLPQAMMCASPRDQEVKRPDLYEEQVVQIGPLRLERDPGSQVLKLNPVVDLGKRTHLSVRIHRKDVGLRLKFNTD
ncbi:hypothetical protein DK842_03520 [Chromobacterium phragmitis]|uniref:Uncharacterized protein n=1 Tax=Chromobacterium phragmitis TaxID=2202141 RepID=A0A344UGM6_9NEIS|nr:hypothetical protein [Chromobacterium phragmitis]AXE29065.1 hypothetical protein DK842_03520 [Chromobacterium phragmitis]AXE34424.1 hypothetical protein DK843_09005 [Chromobacterium phragmitis]